MHGGKIDGSFQRREQVVVVGGGPAGLAAAAALKSKGLSPLVLDQADEVGASWKAHYDRLHLHTVRWLSNLPGLRIPRREGRWVARDGVVRYLKDYADHHRLRIKLSTTVTSVDREDGGWRVTTGDGSLIAEDVVIATGYNREPVLPGWPGLDLFAKPVIHSSAYRNGRPFSGRDVLVVGTGNSGAEIAVDLVESGARTVWLSVRTAPNILRRDLVGLPTQVVGVATRRLPRPLLDGIAAATQRLTVGDLSRYGMPPPARRLSLRVVEEQRIPILDVGLIAAIKKRQVEVVAAVDHLDGDDVVMRDGRRLNPDSVIAATGFRRGLEELVGHLHVLRPNGLPEVHGGATHPRAPGLYFIGYSNPLSGNLRELAIDARRIARAIASRRRRARDARSLRVTETS